MGHGHGEDTIQRHATECTFCFSFSFLSPDCSPLLRSKQFDIYTKGKHCHFSISWLLSLSPTRVMSYKTTYASVLSSTTGRAGSRLLQKEVAACVQGNTRRQNRYAARFNFWEEVTQKILCEKQLAGNKTHAYNVSRPRAIGAVSQLFPHRLYHDGVGLIFSAHGRPCAMITRRHLHTPCLDGREVLWV